MEDEYDLHPDFGITKEQYHAELLKLWDALNMSSNPTGEDVFTLAARAIEDAQQKPSRREIAAMAMQGMLSNPTFGCHRNVAAQEAVKYADALIERLAADPVAEGINLLPMYSRELDKGLTDDQDKGTSR
jgi:hypothetical protein